MHTVTKMESIKFLPEDKLEWGIHITAKVYPGIQVYPVFSEAN